MHNHSYKTSVKKISESKIEIESEIGAEEFAEHIAATLKDATREAEIKGFRKGSAPEKMVRDMLGERLLNDAARSAISHAYGHILEAEKIDAIGYPEISIIKIAEGNPLVFKLTTEILPEIKNFDYKTIAAKENKKESPKIEITDKEFGDALENILKSYAQSMKLDKTPELTDELAKKFGEFANVDDLKKKLREQMLSEKTQKENEKRRLSLIESLVAGTKIEVPEALIENEIERMISEMQGDVARMGLNWTDYLKHAKKSEDDLKKDWREGAKKRVILDLEIAHIAKTEKISADKKKVEDEVEHIKKDHKDIDLDHARGYFERVYQTQAVFEFLEKQK